MPRLPWLAPAILLLLTTACARDRGDIYPDAGQDTGAGADLLPGECGGFGYGAEGCRACVDADCCDEAKACRDDAVCSEALDCVFACAPEDGACRFACWEAFPEPSEAIGNLRSCLWTACPDACEAGYGAGDWVSEECGNCTREGNCNPEAAVCFDDPECHAFQRCLVARCGSRNDDPGCNTECSREASFGAPQLWTFWTCSWNQCRDVCLFGTDWDCVDRFSWPKDQSKEASMRLRFSSLAPEVGTAIRACNFDDEHCDEPLAEARVEEDPVDSGMPTTVATLSGLPNIFNGYFEIDTEAPEGSVPPRQLYLSRSVIDDDFERVFWIQSMERMIQGLELEAGKGAIVAWVWDCRTAGGVGVRFVARSGADEEHSAFYGNSFGRIDQSLEETTDSPLAAFVNLEPGIWTIIANVDDREVARNVVRVRADEITVIDVRPSSGGR